MVIKDVNGNVNKLKVAHLISYIIVRLSGNKIKSIMHLPFLHCDQIMRGRCKLFNRKMGSYIFHSSFRCSWENIFYLLNATLVAEICLLISITLDLLAVKYLL
jgi:hypothetical protein